MLPLALLVCVPRGANFGRYILTSQGREFTNQLIRTADVPHILPLDLFCFGRWHWVFQGLTVKSTRLVHSTVRLVDPALPVPCLGSSCACQAKGLSTNSLTEPLNGLGKELPH